MNELLVNKEIATFNKDIIRSGGFLRIECDSWAEAQNALVAKVTEDLIVAIILGDNSAVHYIRLKSDELADFALTYSNDLVTIYDSQND